MINVRVKSYLYCFIVFFAHAVPAQAMFQMPEQQEAEQHEEQVQRIDSVLRLTEGYMSGHVARVVRACGVPCANAASSLAVVSLRTIVPVYSLAWQQGLYGRQEVRKSIQQLVQEELKKINPAYKNVPIKKKNKNPFFSSSAHFDALIVYPTNYCIYVDEDALLGKSQDMQRSIIRAALQHYDNNTFTKLMTLKISCVGLSTVLTHGAVKKAKQLVGALSSSEHVSESKEHTTEFVSSSSSFISSVKNFGGFVGDMALCIAVQAGVSYVCDKVSCSLINRYFNAQQRSLGIQSDNPQEILAPYKERLAHIKHEKNVEELIQLSFTLGRLQTHYQHNPVIVFAIEQFIQEVTAAAQKELMSSYQPADVV